LTDEIVKQEQQYLTIAERVQDALNTRDPEKLTAMYQSLDQAIFKLSGCRDLLKAALKAHVVEHGTEVSERGTKAIEAAGYRVPVRAMNKEGALDDAKVEGKLRAKQLDIGDGMNATVTWKASKEKLDKLVAAGKWSENDTKDCVQPRKWALYPPEKVQKNE
jgi:hypothetical protein